MILVAEKWDGRWVEERIVTPYRHPQEEKVGQTRQKKILPVGCWWLGPFFSGLGSCHGRQL